MPTLTATTRATLACPGCAEFVRPDTAECWYCGESIPTKLRRRHMATLPAQPSDPRPAIRARMQARASAWRWVMVAIHSFAPFPLQLFFANFFTSSEPNVIRNGLVALFALCYTAWGILVAPVVMVVAIKRLKAIRRGRSSGCGPGPVVAALVSSGITTLSYLLFAVSVFAVAQTLK